MKFNIPQKYRLSVLLYNRKFTIVLSVVLAFALWLGIAITENPVRDQTFTDLTAVVSLENTAASGLGLGITSDVAAKKFSITVSGPNYIVSSLKASDFSLSASTVDINTAGTFTLKVNATPITNKTGYTITKIEPETIDVSVDFIDTKEFVVTPKLTDVRASEGLIADKPVVADSQQSNITIKGPRSVLENINSVEATAKVDKELSVTETFNANISLLDSSGMVLYKYATDGTVYDAKDNIITNSTLTVSFTNLKVTQPISKKKDVKVIPEFSNMPSGITKDNFKYSASLNKVTILGAPEAIEKIESISLKPIDFSEISTDKNEFNVDYVLPNGVSLFDKNTNTKVEEITPVNVKIDTANFDETTVNITNIKCNNTDHKTKTNSNIRVKICGPKDSVKSIKASKLSLVVDLTGKSVGDHSVEAVVDFADYKDVWQVGTINVSVKLYD